MRSRTTGWLAGAILIGAAILAPAAVFADPGNQTNVSSETFSNVSCTGGPNGNITVDDTHVAWVFVHAGATGPGVLTATFTGAGTVTANSYVQGNLKYMIVTARPDTLESFSDNLGGGPLTLSHVCRTDPKPTPTPTLVPTPTPTLVPTPTPTATLPVEPEVTPTPTPTASPTQKPSSSIEGATGTPKTTPPPTDSGVAGSSGTGFGVVVLALGGLAALALIATPARRRTRR